MSIYLRQHAKTTTQGAPAYIYRETFYVSLLNKLSSTASVWAAEALGIVTQHVNDG